MKEADHPRLAGDRFNKEGNLHRKLVLGSCKMSGSLRPPAGILEVFIETLTGCSNIYHPYVLNNTLLSQGYIFEVVASMGIAGRMYIPRIREEVRSL